MRDLLMESYF